MVKKIISSMIVMTMILSMVACSKHSSNEETSYESSLEESTEKRTESSSNEETTVEDSIQETTQGTSDETQDSNIVPLTLMVEDKHLQELGKNGVLCEVTWQNLLLNPDQCDNYPYLNNALEQLQIENDKANKDTMDWMLPEAMLAEEERGEFFNGYTSALLYTVQRADNYIVSVRIDSDSYTGGAHPFTNISSLNLNTETGEHLVLSDVIIEYETVLTRIVQQLEAQYDFLPEGSIEENIKTLDMEQIVWTLGYQGLTVYFSPGEIAANAVGALTTTIWFQDAPELFVEKYMEVPSSGYALRLPLYCDIELNRENNETKKDVLFLSIGLDAYGTKYLNMRLNNHVFSNEQCYAYQLHPYLVCIKNGGTNQFYLYVEGETDNGYPILYVYDLNNDKIQEIGEPLYGTGFHTEVRVDLESGYPVYYDEVFNNIENFSLDTTFDIFGPHIHKAWYHVDTTNGRPTMSSKEYMAPADFPTLTSLIDLEVEIILENDNVEVETMPAGSQFSLIGTDGNTYVRMSLEDGRECYIPIDFSEYPVSIYGKHVWECFEEILFAG